jgi:hypothetical protein
VQGEAREARDPLGIVPQETPYTHMRAAVRAHWRGTRVVRIVHREVGRDLFRVWADQPHEAETRQEDKGDEPPGQGQRIETQRRRPRLREGDQERAAERPDQRAHQHVAHPFGAPIGRIHLGCRQSKLLASAHAESEEYESEQEDGKRRADHRPADGQGPDQAQQEPQH